jgi:UDP-N-acetylglucosamine acyltransferase
VISEHAIIDPTAKIADNVSIGPGSFIGADVEIGEGTWIGPHVVIQGPTIIGKNNKIFQFASLGDAPQDKTYQNEPTTLHIGDNNVIREFCTISRGTVKGGGKTQIGNDNFFMAYTHVGHDCHLEDHVTMVSYSALSGHVHVEHHAIIGGYAAIHQFVKIGAYSFIGRATYVGKDVLPYLMISGYDATTCGLNIVGLKRAGFASASIDTLRRAYKTIFRKGLTTQQALAELESIQQESPEVIAFIDAIQASTRGIQR